jgi:hypothetical protein
LQVIYRQKVDIITSSSVLAERDANDPLNKSIFSVFGIRIDHNCHADPLKRKHAYESSDIIYGVLGNFQRDHLLTEFYDENLMTGHHFENVLVDEVDSMLLDKGNNILYLSQDLPDIEEIESVFVFIWQWLNDNIGDLVQLHDELQRGGKKSLTDMVRSIVLDTAFGVLDECDIEAMSGGGGSGGVNASMVLHRLRDFNLVGDHNVLTSAYDDEKFTAALEPLPASLCAKIKFYCRDKIEGMKPVKVPDYFRRFVMLHIDRWIENGIRALSMEHEKQYIIDRSQSSAFVETDPNIIILDLDTGSDMANSQWDGGLHQFLQLKHGCRLSPMSLKSVFISNVSYFRLYKKLYGMTGECGDRLP